MTTPLTEPLHVPSLVLRELRHHPCSCHEASSDWHREGVADFAIDGTLTLDVVFHFDRSTGLDVRSVTGTGQAWYGGQLPMVGRVADALIAALDPTPTT